MALWKTTDTDLDAGKPKYLNTTEKKNAYATEQGWVYRHGGEYTDVHGNTRRKEEILVAARQLAGINSTARMAEATISAIQFDQSSINVGSAANVIVTFNEEVTVFGSPTLSVDAANTTANTVPASFTATYAGGNNTNRLYFSMTADANAATYTFTNTGITIANTQALQIVDTSANTVAADLTVPGLYTGANSAIGTLTAS